MALFLFDRISLKFWHTQSTKPVIFTDLVDNCEFSNGVTFGTWVRLDRDKNYKGEGYGADIVVEKGPPLCTALRKNQSLAKNLLGDRPLV